MPAPSKPPASPAAFNFSAMAEDLFEDSDRSLTDVHRLVEVAEDLQFGGGDGDVDRGRADVDTEEPEVRVEPDVVRTAAAARGGESVGRDEPRLQQPVHLDGQLGPGEFDLVAQLGTGVGAAVTEQLQQTGLVRVRRSSGHASHVPLPASFGHQCRAFDGERSSDGDLGKKSCTDSRRLFPLRGQRAWPGGRPPQRALSQATLAPRT
ncbi:hypothetical protein GCM10017687_87760 [Streptomyces echinatus]